MNGYLLISLLCGLTFFTLGVKLNRDPGSMDAWLAYHTRSSRRNEDTWYEANIFAGRCLMIIGTLLLLLLILIELLLKKSNLLLYVFSFVNVLSIGIVYLSTEIHLKRLFFRDGKRRPKF